MKLTRNFRVPSVLALVPRRVASVLGATTLAAAVGLAVAAPAQAGTLVVSGDGNIANALTGDGGVPFNPGNGTFFSNLLGSGSSVAIDYGQGGGYGANFAGDIRSYYGGHGKSVTTYNGNLTAADLQNVQMFVSVMPDNGYSSSQLGAISALLARGGTVFFLGENANYFGAEDVTLNADLVALGSTMRLGGDSLDGGLQTAFGNQIANDPLTHGVTTFGYAYVDSVSGGSDLFNTMDGTPFIEYTATTTPAVPEPSSLMAMMAGLLGFVIVRRRAGR